MNYNEVLEIMHKACELGNNKCDNCTLFGKTYCRERYALATMLGYDLIKNNNIDWSNKEENSTK